MAINKKLIHFQTMANFEAQLSAGNILDTSIVFIKDAKKIWTHDEFYDCSTTDLSEYLTSEEIAEIYTTKEELERKQDVIEDLEYIRDGAKKGTTALQSDSLFIGTQEEYNKIYSEGGIKVGALVIILDGSESVNDTIALLGTAILGKMVLGQF